MISSFYKPPKKFLASELANLCDCKLIGDGKKVINNVGILKHAKENELSFLGNPKYLDDLKNTKAGLVIVDEKYLSYVPSGTAAILTKNVMPTYGRLLEVMFDDSENTKNSEYIDNTAVIHESARIGKNARISAYVVVGPNAEIGDNCSIDSFTKIGANVKLGSSCEISSNVSIDYAILGDNVRVHAGAKIGQPGFGIVPAGDHMVYIKQLGRVVIGNNVRIGANTTIDRGAIEDTVIGDDTIIDNLVQIAHNVRVGCMVTLVSQVGIAGSSVIDDGAILAGQVGVSGHIRVGKHVVVAAKSGIASSIEDGCMVGGIPAVDIMTWKRQSAFLKRSVNKKGTNKDE